MDTRPIVVFPGFMPGPLAAMRAMGALRASSARMALLTMVAICALRAVSAHAEGRHDRQDRRDQLLRRDQLIENQQLDRLQEDRERALRAVPPPDGADLDAVAPAVTAPAIDVPCREIREIRLNGDAQRVPADVRAHIEQAFAGRCLGVAELEAILALLTRSFIERGYVTTRAYLPAQDLRAGTLTVTVVDGVIERYDVDSNRPRAIWPRGVFPANPGQLLNLRDLENAIEQINRLASNDARLELRPGSAPGQTVVVVRNRAARPLHLQASLDNMNPAATGRNSLSATLTADSLLGANELFALTRRQSVFPLEGGHRAEATAFYAQMPYGYNQFSMQIARSGYVNTVTLPSGRTLKVEGRTDVVAMGAERVVHRGQFSKLQLSARLTMQTGKTWVAGQALRVSSRDFTFLDVGVQGSTAVLGGSLAGRFGLVQGLAALGAYHDPPGLPKDAPHAQFSKLTLMFGYGRRIGIAGRTLVVSSQWNGQYAGDTLYGTQQILIGGPSSVRGFLNHTLAGDHGYYVRNELSLPWQAAAWNVRGRLYAGLDWGTVINRAAGIPSGALTGTAVGLAMTWKRVSLDASASRAVRTPYPRMREGTLFGLRLTGEI